MTLSSALPTIDSADARHYLMHSQGLLGDPARQCSSAVLLKTIVQMGFVQIDSIQTIQRAHHLTMASRFDDYQPAQLTYLAEKKRGLFEHWTHDASAIPIEFYPYWRARLVRRPLTGGWVKRLGPKPQQVLETVLARVRDEGPKRSQDFTKENGRKGGGAWWGWTPEKTALEYLWRSGELSSVLNPAGSLFHSSSTSNCRFTASYTAFARANFFSTARVILSISSVATWMFT